MNLSCHLLLTCAILIVHCTSGYSQQIKLSGQIMDQSDSSLIEFAHVYVKNSTQGIYSNNFGEFSFNIPDSLNLDTLVVSRVGYASANLPLVQIDLSTSLRINLNESALNLDEIVIYGHRDSIALIVRKMLKRIRRNYPTKLHYLEGFYRELSLKGDAYTRLIEASIRVTENSYMKEYTTSKVKIRQLRKSEDYREYSLKNKLFEASMRKMAKLAWDEERDNNIFDLLKMNYPKNNKGNITIWAKEYNFIEAFDFEIDKITKVGNSLYYHIKFQMPPESSSAVAYYGGEMVINLDDYAIAEWKYGMIAHPYKTFPSQHSGFYFEGKYYNQHHIIYSKIGKKYYPTYFEKFDPSYGGTTLHVDKLTGEKSSQYDKVTFMVNRVVAKKKEFERIKKRNALDNEVDVYDIDYKYDSTFWDNYNILLLDPLLKSAKEDLEKENTLKEQFEKNGE